MELSENQKLTLIFRVEAGCLGPTGDELIEDFCQFAQTKFEALKKFCIHWQIEPRVNKELAEMQYQVLNKDIPRNFAQKYFERLERDIDTFEMELNDNLIQFIEEFQGR